MGLKLFLRIISILFFIIIVICFIFFVYWKFRPNDSHQVSELAIETWKVIDNAKHNAFSDLIFWKGLFYLTYRESCFHAGSTNSKIIVMSSSDAKNWNEVIRMDGAGTDIRDPKFAIVKNRLFVFALKGAKFLASPTYTAYSFTYDGKTWFGFIDIHFNGWLIWRPKTIDSLTWYAPFYWNELGESYLLKSTDCVTWNKTGKIYRGNNTNETEITFLNDSTIISVERAFFSDNFFDSPEGFTVISKSTYPYNKWISHNKSFVTRLDGPTLFTFNGNVYAIGRYQPHTGGIFQYLGGLFSRKRTALYIIKNNKIIYLSDVLSDGDTAYSGALIIGDTLYFSYYTSDITKDYPWVFGMFSPTSIRMGKVNLKTLEKFASSK